MLIWCQPCQISHIGPCLRRAAGVIPLMDYRELAGIKAARDVRACHVEILRQKAIRAAGGVPKMRQALVVLPDITAPRSCRAWAHMLFDYRLAWMQLPPEQAQKQAGLVNAVGALLSAILLLAEARIEAEPQA